ncbi:SHOCT domain-containing protein [Halorussus halophilus]|uniref:SHOCT domain-containing protein n=1 Tax=Halorussus halophilus TaxID=2650975 RepID=UPI0013013136|nr:SHOCT domain-containing protein [Halorussus halophilus]
MASSSSNQLDTATIILLIIGAIIVLPMLTMGMGFGGMMGYGGMMGGYGTSGGWWPLIGMALQLGFLLVLLGGGYLVFRRVTETQSSRDSALEELRTAYARGDISDEEFENRRTKLNSEGSRELQP